MRKTIIGLKEYVIKNSVPEPNTGCWLWTKSFSGNPKEYGQASHPQGHHRAHRLSYEAFFGPIDPKLVVCHKCDTPPCVNPSHLFIGTQLDNMQDRKSKGKYLPNSGQFKIKSHCSDGHEFTKENTYLRFTTDGKIVSRSCRECRKIKGKIYKKLIRR